MVEIGSVSVKVAYVLPVPEGQIVQLTRRDLASGWVMHTDDYAPLPTGSNLFDLGEMSDSLDGPPQLLGASPFELIRFQEPPVGVTDRLRKTAGGALIDTEAAIGALKDGRIGYLHSPLRPAFSSLFQRRRRNVSVPVMPGSFVQQASNTLVARLCY